MPTKKKNSNYTLGKKVLFDVTLPSGATCQARRPGVQGFIAAGVLDSFDSLTALVQTEHIEKNSTKPPTPGKITPEQAMSAGKAMLADPAKMEVGFQLIDRLAAYCIIQPEVWIDYRLKDESDEAWHRRQQRAEENEALGISEVDLEDRLFLLNWAVGGSADLEAFREGLAGNMGSLAGMQSLQGSAE